MTAAMARLTAGSIQYQPWTRASAPGDHHAGGHQRVGRHVRKAPRTLMSCSRPAHEEHGRGGDHDADAGHGHDGHALDGLRRLQPVHHPLRPAIPWPPAAGMALTKAATMLARFQPKVWRMSGAAAPPWPRPRPAGGLPRRSGCGRRRRAGPKPSRCQPTAASTATKAVFRAMPIAKARSKRCAAGSCRCCAQRDPPQGSQQQRPAADEPQPDAAGLEFSVPHAVAHKTCSLCCPGGSRRILAIPTGIAAVCAQPGRQIHRFSGAAQRRTPHQPAPASHCSTFARPGTPPACNDLLSMTTPGVTPRRSP